MKTELVVLFVLLLLHLYQKRFSPTKGRGVRVEGFESPDQILFGLNQGLQRIANQDNYKPSNPDLSWVRGDRYTTPDENPELLRVFNQTLSVLSSKLGFDFNLMNIQEVIYDTNTVGDKRYSFRASIFDPKQLFAGEINLVIAKNHTESANSPWHVVFGSMYSSNKGLYTDLFGIQGANEIKDVKFPFSTPAEQAKTQSRWFSSLEKQVVSQEHVDDIVAQIDAAAKGDKPAQYLCFDGIKPNAVSKEDCEQNGGGVWDTEVKDSSECPFFNANKNYPNSRGGLKLDYGYCEIPDGAQLVGFRHIDPNPEYAPMCHNCVDPVSGLRYKGRCCGEQKNNPNLASPDYAFPGDSSARQEHIADLHRHGLTP